MPTSAKTSPLRRLVNILSDAVTQIDEKYASAGLEFPTLDKPFNEKDPACILLSDPDVVPLSSVIVAAADQLIVSARHPMQAILDIAQFVSTLSPPPHIRICKTGLCLWLISTPFLRAWRWPVRPASRRFYARRDRRLVFISPRFVTDTFLATFRAYMSRTSQPGTSSIQAN